MMFKSGQREGYKLMLMALDLSSHPEHAKFKYFKKRVGLRRVRARLPAKGWGSGAVVVLRICGVLIDLRIIIISSMLGICMWF